LEKTNYHHPRGFGSDNHSGVHPRFLEAILRVNDGHMPSYGVDPVSEAADRLFQTLFGSGVKTHFVFNGTAANVLALGAMVKSHHSVLASAVAHIVQDECGAPEKALGCKVIAVPAPHAKLTPELLRPYLIRRGDQHFSQVRAISITQPTELGTLYSVAELRALCEFAKKERLYVHMDGSRLVNAVAKAGVSFREMTTDVGVDVLSLGGTKNGMLFGEAVVFLNPSLGEDFKFARKQLMQLPSKTRFLAAQFLEFLGTDLWRENAQHANKMAARLSQGLQQSAYAQVTEPAECNAVFVRFPKQMIAGLKSLRFFYVWNESSFECRLMMSWDTTENDIDEFLSALAVLGDRLVGETKLLPGDLFKV
jgi:threonine aldolase